MPQATVLLKDAYSHEFAGRHDVVVVDPPFADDNDKLLSLFGGLAGSVREGGTALVFSDWRNMARLQNIAARKTGWHLGDCLIFAEGQGKDYEAILRYFPSRPSRVPSPRGVLVLRGGREELASVLLRGHAREGASVLECFASEPFAAQAIALGMDYSGVTLDESVRARITERLGSQVDDEIC